MHRCDNEFIRENSDIREFSEFRDIMERGAGAEYALFWGAFYLELPPPSQRGLSGEYAPREGASLLNTAHPARVVLPIVAG